ncbi:MAG: hypothetical protein ACYDCK_10125 [Thermoplasmatota archaeon]
MRALADDPSGVSVGIGVRPLKTKSSAPPFRARVGRWRVVFTVTEAHLAVTRLFPRESGDDWLNRDEAEDEP